MAELVEGDQYCLSSNTEITDNKIRIRVKLTDSALRAIDDFQRNGDNQRPKIHFAEDGGQFAFPSTQSSDGSARFNFTLSDNRDQRGFECIQQTGPNSLESLGPLMYKMQIQANDDVFEATRLAVAKENDKKKSAMFIKENGPNIGRKVKVISSERTIPQPKPTIRHRESMSIPTSGSQTSRSKPSAPPAAPSTTSSSTLSSSKKNPPPTKKKTLPKKETPDIMRKTLRERIIHLLALRPYKRPGIYCRLNNEGFKDSDRPALTPVLKSVANMKDNWYHLLPHVWNDVQEDWPFYSEQEKEMLKRRKPEILKSPILSDESGGSGQSANSTGAGRPSAIMAPPPSLINLKRPGYCQSADGLPTKKRRISHCQRPESSTTAGSNNNNGNRENARTAGISSSGSGLGNNASVPSENNIIGGDSNSVASVAGNNSNNGASDNTPNIFGYKNALSPFYNINSNTENSEYPDPLTSYTTITSFEQRERYKSDYRSESAEYVKLNREVRRVTGKYEALLAEFKREIAAGNRERYRALQDQIIEMHDQAQNDSAYQEIKRRFRYLHKKLCRIIKLIDEYDSKTSADTSASGTAVVSETDTN